MKKNKKNQLTTVEQQALAAERREKAKQLGKDALTVFAFGCLSALGGLVVTSTYSKISGKTQIKRF